ncbi:MAG: response regulator transcription factor [Proteobacteria bacterium]|nr:response regulator transcription factor [Pseudomonadota bacterium]MDA0926443.1 response regulator transcription factor [Pseudomonadota bacterium]
MKIAIVDDHEIFRLGLKVLLTTLEEIDSVVEFASGLELLESRASLLLDLVVIDFSMPDCTGLEIIQRLSEAGDPVKVILLTASASSAILKEARSLGVNGLVAKRGSGEEVLLAVRAVAEDQNFISPEFESLLAQCTVLDTLTKREMQVLKAILEGNSTREVSALLNVSFKTVDTHRTRLMQKLGVHNLTELMEMARENGLLKEI